jgi:uncharacterized protein (TIGR00369 family)
MEGDDRRLAEVRERFAGSPFHAAFLGLRLDRVAEGEVDVSLDLEPRHRNLAGTLHGGMIATLADTATGLAYRTVLEPGTEHVTSTLGVTFLSPGRQGTVTARGRVVRRGRRFGYAEADVVDSDGTLLARATATFTVLRETAQ